MNKNGWLILAKPGSGGLIPVLIQLNRGEGRHRLARAVFFGRKGEVRQRYRKGQEDQLGALGLVVNVIVLWNTLYMDKALAHPQAKGLVVNPEDVARFNPLGQEHINMLGRYTFALNTALQSNGLRPLVGRVGAGVGGRVGTM